MGRRNGPPCGAMRPRICDGARSSTSAAASRLVLLPLGATEQGARAVFAASMSSEKMLARARLRYSDDATLCPAR